MSTTLILSKLTVTQSASGGQVQSWSTIQEIIGSLQAINSRERAEWNKETTQVDWKFYVKQSQFTSTTNEAELKENAILLKLNSLASTTINVNSASGQTILNVVSSSGFSAQEFVIIGKDTAREEIKKIASTASGKITMTGNLTYTHTLAQADLVEHLTYYNIIGVENWTDAGDHYKVFLQEKK